MNPPSRDTAGGTAYLDLQQLARRNSRPVDELFQLYALEGFLRRLTVTHHRDDFVLKGGVLLAAYTHRRPTRDVDLAGVGIAGDIDSISAIINDVISIDINDGITDLRIVHVDEIREDAEYPGIRVTVTARLDRARLRFHVDINIGDPLWPEPDLVELPQILVAEPIRLRGYSPELILAEKIVTAIQRGTASTRWRDFVDIASLADTKQDIDRLNESIERVAHHRAVHIQLLAEILDGFADLAQPQWAAWRRRHQLEDSTPERFGDLLHVVVPFADRSLAAIRD